MQARFDAKKKDILKQFSVPAGEYTDASPKGSVDEPIRELVDEINNTNGYVTTSSCSGRLAVFLEGPPRVTATPSDGPEGEPTNAENGLSVATSAGGKGGGKWLFTSHAPVGLANLDEEGAVSSLLGFEATKQLSFPKGDDDIQRVHLKFEPMILHILTSSIEHAQLALTAATAAGFRESGVSSLMNTKGHPTPPMVAVRSSGLAFDATIGYMSEGRVLPMVSEAYLHKQLRCANQHFQTNEERTARFRSNFLKATSSVCTSASDAVHSDRDRRKPLSDKQRRKEARKEAFRTTFDQHEPSEFYDSPEVDVAALMSADTT
ncbi:hypothetical protein LTR09_006653 [Extremus antarcticus]|uniref:tRNA(Phe) 7-[(3-amino-3-carboxypropyl)-4-demethylwyosine(37)-N(4)]-methyltransferase n=1 Tax=Extremus antarcticus TaxID=702011 RepID=A0AAJ0GBG2_9PEZI|nr:hypothetical protein LTR09_006653 [Extremus antarcticus]